MFVKDVDVHLRFPDLHGLHHRDANAGADIAHQIKDTGSVAHPFPGYRIVCNRGQRHKDQAQPRPLERQRQPETP